MLPPPKKKKLPRKPFSMAKKQQVKSPQAKTVLETPCSMCPVIRTAWAYHSLVLASRAIEDQSCPVGEDIAYPQKNCPRRLLTCLDSMISTQIFTRSTLDLMRGSLANVQFPQIQKEKTYLLLVMTSHNLTHCVDLLARRGAEGGKLCQEENVVAQWHQGHFVKDTIHLPAKQRIINVYYEKQQNFINCEKKCRLYSPSPELLRL